MAERTGIAGVRVDGMQVIRRGANGKATTFLNVDLDIYGRSSLEPLVSAFGQTVDVLHVGREGLLYSAHLELAGYPKNADGAIRNFAKLVQGLPPAERKLWDAASRREFNVGVQAALRDRPFEIEIAPRTIQIVSMLNARIVVTVYAPELVTGRVVRK